MCFHIQPFTFPEQAAKEDITVYKVIKNNNISIFQDFQYAPNTLYRLGKKLMVNELDEIHQGFHSYSSMSAASGPWRNNKTVAFTIPKGAKYYYNSDYREYVSTSIRSGDLVAL